MFLKRVLPALVILIAGLSGLCGYLDRCTGEVDRTYQNGWENVFTVKVERTVEKCSFVPGAHYVFSSKLDSEKDWHEVMTFRHDDPLELSEQNVQIVNERVAVVSMGWKAAVTSDGGKTWNLWNAELDLPNWKGPNYSLIEEISLSDKGEGKMVLNPRPNRNEPKELLTVDFGKTRTISD